MRLTALLSGLFLSLVAGAAMACPSAERCGADRYGPPSASYEQPRHDPFEDAYRDGYDAGYADGRDSAYDEDRYGGYESADAPGAWRDERGLYIHGHRGGACGCASPPPCNCEAGLTLSSSFFDGAGGVGPIPDGGYYSGGGYYYSTSSGGSAYAFSSASARASARVSVSYRGGYSYRPPGGHGGHKRH